MEDFALIRSWNQ